MVGEDNNKNLEEKHNTRNKRKVFDIMMNLLMEAWEYTQKDKSMTNVVTKCHLVELGSSVWTWGKGLYSSL